jgi:predicted  nucleic acid-binding Zn-ribbon protein
MKKVFSVFLLVALVGLSGCSEETAPPAPTKPEKAVAVQLPAEDLMKKCQEIPAHQEVYFIAIICVLIVVVALLILGGLMVHKQSRLLTSGQGNADPRPHDGAPRLTKEHADKKTLDYVSTRVQSLEVNTAKIERAVTTLTQRTNEVEELKRSLNAAEQRHKDLETARDDAINSLSPAQEEAGRLKIENDQVKRDLAAVKLVEQRAQEELASVKSDCKVLDESRARLQGEVDVLSGEKSRLEHSLGQMRGDLSSAESALGAARLAGQASASQLEASFVQLAPKTLVDPEILTFMRKLHGEALAGSVSATAAWSTLTAFAAAEADPQAKDFQLHILKRLGTVLVNYWKGQGSPPKDSHERLTHWARCLNEQAKGRYNLFVPAIGAPVDRTKMTTASSASIVQDVLCWQVRNPAGANYSLAEVA